MKTEDDPITDPRSGIWILRPRHASSPSVNRVPMRRPSLTLATNLDGEFNQGLRDLRIVFRYLAENALKHPSTPPSGQTLPTTCSPFDESPSKRIQASGVLKSREHTDSVSSSCFRFAPIRPRPIMPICMGNSVCEFGSGTTHNDDAVRGRYRANCCRVCQHRDNYEGVELPHICFERLKQALAQFVRSTSQVSARPGFSRNSGFHADTMLPTGAGNSDAGGGEFGPGST